MAAAEEAAAAGGPADLQDALQLAAHSAVARALAENDEGGALSAWVGAFIAMVAMIAAAAGIGVGALLYQRAKIRNGVLQKVHTSDDHAAEIQKPLSSNSAMTPLRTAGTASSATKQQAWRDDDAGDNALPPEVRKELAETLRSVLEEEISRGLHKAGINERLERLEQQARDQQVVSGSLLPPSKAEAKDTQLSETLKAKDAIHPMEAPGSHDHWGELDSTLKVNPALNRDVELADVSEDDAPKRKDSGVVRHNKVLSPSNRQKRYSDPPELSRRHVDEDSSLSASLVTVQRNLSRRDVQCQELHRQLKAAMKECAHLRLEASHFNKRLQDLLTNPAIGTHAQAEEIHILRAKVEELSGRLAETKSSEMQWSLIAKRQRAFFMQQERLSQEGLNLLKKHPAGEIFLAPPPVYLEDDIDEEPHRLKVPWDVGTSHANPYVTDSWPFEPNACAQRVAVEPNLNRWEEEDVMMMDTDSEDGSHPSDADRGMHIRLPTLPPESPVEAGFDPPEPEDSPTALHPVVDGNSPMTLTARSL
mmetsp:Transcript_133691/g.243792  ORF Transcript_133691/g.243792 Transcript_133691/m.243792 type:complete len:534 (+) Transcript_133691:151-1752(+)